MISRRKFIILSLSAISVASIYKILAFNKKAPSPHTLNKIAFLGDSITAAGDGMTF